MDPLMALWQLVSSGINKVDNLMTPSAYADAASIPSSGIAYVESRGASRKKLETEGPAGELGKYQMTPPAWNDLARLNHKYKTMDRFKTLTNDALAEQALRDYLNILESHYARIYKIDPTDENLIQMYNVGPVAFHKGVRNPKYVETYKRGLSQ